MTISASPTTSNLLAAMRSFLVAVVPSDVQVIAGQPNRVAEPSVPRFIVMSPPRFERIEFNTDAYLDSKFTAAISGTVMNVSAFDPTLNGPITVGSIIYGAGLAVPTTVTALGTGTGGTGSYTVSPSQNIASRTMSAGQQTVTMPAKATIQLDFHSADQTSGDLANTVSALLRDSFGVNLFANQSPAYAVPLYADDARELPFYNAEQQLEWRWVVDALLQANIVVSVPQQFADSVALTVTDVQVAYP
jgi:hypothetical protein